MMKARENFALKAAAFLLAAAFAAGIAALAAVQLLNAEAMWGGDGGRTSIYEVRRLMLEDWSQLQYLLVLRGEEKAGEAHSASERSDLTALEERFAPAGTNLRWQLLDADDHVLAGSPGVSAWDHTDRLLFPFWSGFWTDESNYLHLYLWLDDAMAVDDPYLAAVTAGEGMAACRGLYLAGTAALAAGFLALCVFLCAGAGHKAGVEGIYLHGFHRLPGDVLLLVLLLCGVGIFAVWVEFITNCDGRVPLGFIAGASAGLAALTAVLVLTALTTFAARCKAHTLLRGTLIWRACAFLRRLAKRAGKVLGAALAVVPMIWKALLACAAYFVLTFYVISSYYYNGGAFLLWLAVSAAGTLYLLLWAAQWKRIRRGAAKIIGGDPLYHIDTRQMLPDLRGHADELNNLGQAISAAVEDRMRSERFKAELITNVSHDLKTPLTSIINYVDLLKKRPIQDPEALEYIEVLDRKSQRLKKLTEDLVEASKASTGNLAVDLERLDLRQLADQALAECGERLAASGLTVIRTLPEEPVWVEADGRHLWRVLDNLLTNCAKYALENTRVYVELRTGDGRAELWVKNISRDPLDIPAERLMERFVRGDESRSAQGSGLGLSIAQSLTELQGGRFSVSVDGDLFKAVVELPLALGTGLD